MQPWAQFQTERDYNDEEESVQVGGERRRNPDINIRIRMDSRRSAISQWVFTLTYSKKRWRMNNLVVERLAEIGLMSSFIIVFLDTGLYLINPGYRVILYISRIQGYTLYKQDTGLYFIYPGYRDILYISRIQGYTLYIQDTGLYFIYPGYRVILYIYRIQVILYINRKQAILHISKIIILHIQEYT